MNSPSAKILPLVASWALLSSLFIVAPSAHAQTETVLYSFGISPNDGAAPYAQLIMDKNGNLYGTTSGGGAYASGTVFRLSSAGHETLLYTFRDQPDGQYPYASLMLDAGNLYGTTNAGGAYNFGAVYRIASDKKESVLYSFGAQAGDGQNSYSNLVRDQSGNFYGTNVFGGPTGNGAVFKLTPTGTETVLYGFGNQPDGNQPWSGLIIDKEANLYGVTSAGGSYGGGNAYKVTSTGTETEIYGFGLAEGDGYAPFCNLIDYKGNLYGTTADGGAYGGGMVFKLTPAGKETILYSFGSHIPDGAHPYAGLVADDMGNLYGTTTAGGTNNLGTVFELTPSGEETVLYSFAGTPDGSYPYAGLILDKAGNLYGTTTAGGAAGAGTVYKLSLPAPSR